MKFEVKFESNVNVVIKQLDHGNVGTLSLRKTLNMTEEFGRGKLTDINEESNCDEKANDVEEVTGW